MLRQVTVEAILGHVVPAPQEPNVFPGRIGQEVSVAAADGAVARDDCLLRNWRRELHLVSQVSAVAIRRVRPIVAVVLR